MQIGGVYKRGNVHYEVIAADAEFVYSVALLGWDTAYVHRSVRDGFDERNSLVLNYIRVRMWGVHPREMCKAHIISEHRDMHEAASLIESGKSLRNYTTTGLLDTSQIQSRHDALGEEMRRRGYTYASPLSYRNRNPRGRIDPHANRNELARRCPECAAIQDRRFHRAG